MRGPLQDGSGRGLHALLVWPKFGSFSFWNFERVCQLVGVKYMTPPLGLLTVAALLPASWELRLVDEVVVGGPDPTLHPMLYRSTGAGFLCLGEAELTIPRFLADLAQGVTSGVYEPGGAADLAGTPVPRFELVDHRDYLYMAVQYSRGCPHHCEFCNVIDLFEHRYRTKSPAQVLAELEALYRLGYRGQVDFFDDNLVGHVPKAKALLRELAGWLERHGHPTFLRLCWTATRAGALRRPYWRALTRVVLENPSGLEAFATLSVLYLHFQGLLPYCEEQLGKQKAAIARLGETRWLEQMSASTPEASLG